MLSISRFAMLCMIALLCVVDGIHGENLGELAAQQAISLVGRDIPYSQSTGSSGSKGWDNGYLAADSKTIKNDGIDCSGLVMWAYNRALEGTTITDQIKSSNPQLGASAFLIATEKTNIITTNQKPSRSDLRPGDLIFLDTTGSIDHVAMYVGNGYVVHSSPQNKYSHDTSLNNLIYNETNGNQGTIIDGPNEKDSNTWWKIEYEDGIVGWSAQKNLVSMGTSEDVPPAASAATVGVFDIGSAVQVSSDGGADVRSTPELYATGVTMLSLENWLNIPLGDTKYGDHIYGYGGPDSITIDVQTAPSEIDGSGSSDKNDYSDLEQKSIRSVREVIDSYLLLISGYGSSSSSSSISYEIIGAKSFGAKTDAARYMNDMGITYDETQVTLAMIDTYGLEDTGFCIVVVKYNLMLFGQGINMLTPAVCDEKGESIGYNALKELSKGHS